MRTTKEYENCIPPLQCLQKLLLFLFCHFTSVLSQCEIGLESTCVWMHDKETALLWKMKREGQESSVELSKCIVNNCGIGIIHSPWLPPRDTEVSATIEYKIFGTSSVYLRLNMHLDDNLNPHQIFSKVGNYAYGYPKTWKSDTVKIPATHTRYKLALKAILPYPEAMVAVKGITLDGTVYLTSTSTTTSSTTTTTTTSSSVPRITASTSTKSTTITTPTRSTTTTTTTTTTTDIPFIEEEEISPTNYAAEIEECSTSIPETAETSEKRDYFLDEEEDDDDDEGNEDGRRFQVLEVDNFIGEEDLITGYTTVVEPQLCMYK